MNKASASAATANTTAVMEATEKKVMVKSAVWKAACRIRATRGRTNGQFLLTSRDRPPLPPPEHIQKSFGKAPMRM